MKKNSGSLQENEKIEEEDEEESKEEIFMDLELVDKLSQDHVVMKSGSINSKYLKAVIGSPMS